MVPSPQTKHLHLGGIFVGILLGALVTYPAIWAAIISGGLGHGNYEFSRAVFPVPMLLTLWTGDRIASLSIVLAFVQLPLYGAILGQSCGRPTWIPGTVLLALHMVAALACFSGLLPNFS